jgi:hypothetical protein
MISEVPSAEYHHQVAYLLALERRMD